MSAFTASRIFSTSKPHYELLDGLRGVAAPYGDMVSLLRGIRHISGRSGIQPRLSGRRLFLRPVGLRDRLCLRRPVASGAYQRRIHAAACHPPSSDACHGSGVGRRSLYDPGRRTVGSHSGSVMVCHAVLPARHTDAPGAPHTAAEVRGNGEMFPLNGPAWSLFLNISQA